MKGILLGNRLHVWKPSRWLRIAIYAVLYLGLITLAPLPDRLILFPTTDRLDAGAAARKVIPFQSGELEVWTAQSALAQQRGQPEVYVLRFYGNADRADRWVAAEAEMWNNRAVEVWGMNYPGFGAALGQRGSRAWGRRPWLRSTNCKRSPATGPSSSSVPAWERLPRSISPRTEKSWD